MQKSERTTLLILAPSNIMGWYVIIPLGVIGLLSLISTFSVFNGVAGILAILVFLNIPARLTMGGEGIQIAWLGRTHFVERGSITNISKAYWGVCLELKNGKTVLIMRRFNTRRGLEELQHLLEEWFHS